MSDNARRNPTYWLTQALGVVGQTTADFGPGKTATWMFCNAEGAKPLKGLGSGVLEIAVRHRTDAYRVVYVTEIAGTL